MQVVTLWWTSIPRNLNVWAAYVPNITFPIYTVLLQSTWSVPYTVQVLWELPSHSFSVYVWLRTKELHTNKEIQGKDLEKSLSDWVLKMTFCACKFIYSWIGFEGSNILLPESMYKTLSAFVKSIVLFLFTWNLCSMISSTVYVWSNGTYFSPR